MDYVVGFLFDQDNEALWVALIEKTHPDWQKGKFNGIGGKIQIGETPHEAMQREFKEEAGVNVKDWRLFCKYHWREGYIYFFVAHGNYEIKTMEEERVSWFPIHDLPELPLIPNLAWLIPLAIDKDKVTVFAEDDS